MQIKYVPFIPTVNDYLSRYLSKGWETKKAAYWQP